MFKKILVFAIIITFGVQYAGITHVQKAQALSGSQFQAGNIIDDPIFYQPNSLTASQIQTFLNAKVPTCDTNGTQMYNSTMTRAQYGTSKGYPPPYICLKSYTQNTPSEAAISTICGYLPARTNQTAAQIISQVSSACGISPKVLIVLLQKEEGLVTDTWPWPSQYQKAAGFACPDTSGCNTAYYGFFNQVYNAAKQFQLYRANPTNYNYIAGQNNSIRYNPNAACGSKTVYIQNQATAGLYNYTPYTPNLAALRNLYGSGDSCSAYGNRNFWRYFNDWFGTTQATPFFKMSGDSKIYIQGDNSTYYYVPSPAMMSTYGYGSKFTYIQSVPSYYTNGMSYAGVLPMIAKFGSNPIYLMDSGGAHHFPDQATLNAFGYQIGQEAQLQSWMYDELSHPEDMALVVRQATAPEVYYVQSGKKSHIINPTAYNTLGSPVYSSQASVRLTDAYVATLPLGAPIMPADTFVRLTDTGTYGVWDGAKLQPVSKTTGNEMALAPDYSAPAYVINQLPLSSTPLDSLAQDSSSNLFMLAGGKKLTLTAAQLTNFGLTQTDFVATRDNLLARIASAPLSTTLIRIDGQAPIYDVKSGQLYHIPTKQDFLGLGYHFADVLNLGSTTGSLFTNNDNDELAIGRPVRIGGAPEVYIVDSTSSKSYVPTRQVLNAYGYTISDVLSLSTANLAPYPNSSQSLAIYMKDGAGNVCLIDASVRHNVPLNLQASSYYNINSSSLTTITDSLLASRPKSVDMTDTLRDISTGRVYRIANGKKYWYTSRSSFESHNGNWAKIVNISDDFLGTIPSGPNIN